MDIHDVAVKLTTRLVVKLVLACVLLVTAAMLLFPRPTDADPDLHSLLLPPTDCRAPCFMGISPGVTTFSESVKRLQANPLIQSLAVTTLNQYNEQSIQAFVTLRPEQIQLFLDAQNGIVESITLLDIRVPLANVVVMLGQPIRFVLNNTLNRGFITYAGFYPQYQMAVVFDFPACSLDLRTFWNVERLVSISIESPHGYAERTDYYHMDAYQSNEGWAKQIADMKWASCA